MVKWLKEKDVLLRLLAIVFAILMWLFVIDEENPDYSNRYRKIPLQIEGIEHFEQRKSDNHRRWRHYGICNLDGQA